MVPQPELAKAGNDNESQAGLSQIYCCRLTEIYVTDTFFSVLHHIHHADAFTTPDEASKKRDKEGMSHI